MTESLQTSVEQSRRKLLQLIVDSPDVTFVRPFGNLGDHLIYAGVRQLLSECTYREAGIMGVKSRRGHTALVPGAGAFCGSYDYMTEYLPLIEERFEQVIILPSSFDVNVETVRRCLSDSKAIVFAREQTSYEQIRHLCHCEIAHDCAFFFDFRPYQRSGQGVLTAYRTDRESALSQRPGDNNDISLTGESLDEWLWTIARHAVIRTDRAHVMIAGALLGKRVEYWVNSYHKVQAIAEYALKELPVRRVEPGRSLNPVNGGQPAADPSACAAAGRSIQGWLEGLHRARGEITHVVPESTLILVDDQQLGELPLGYRRVIPFLERDGQYCGSPSDDRTAIEELERLRRAGAGFMVFAWTSFWWLDYYPGLHQHLRSNYSCALENERVIVFNLNVH